MRSLCNSLQLLLMDSHSFQIVNFKETMLDNLLQISFTGDKYFNQDLLLSGKSLEHTREEKNSKRNIDSMV